METKLWWCSGEVTKVISEKPPSVEVLWDGTPDILGSEQPSTSTQKLLPTKFNKDKEGAWRMDMDIELEKMTAMIMMRRRVIMRRRT